MSKRIGGRGSEAPSIAPSFEVVVTLVIVASVVSLAIGYEVGYDDATETSGLPLPVQSAHPGNGIDDPVPPSKRIVDEIGYILNHTTSTNYEHHPALGANISRAGGIYNTDCSGYVDYVLNLTVPAWYDAISYYDAGERPLAEDLYGFFAQARPERGWTRIRKMADAQPGDVLAYKHPIHDPNTGHVMFVYSTPEPSTVNDNEYWVWVSDSTASYHGDDPRKDIGDGVGKGKMWFGVDHDGRPVYFRWSSVDGEQLYYPISIARATQANDTLVPSADRVANRAEYVVHMQQLTVYWHHTIIQEEDFAYIADCSGFVDFVLNRELPGHYAQIAFDQNNESRPLAQDYYDYFASLGAGNSTAAWSRVAEMKDARPGDIIAYKHDPPSEGSTGHVMIIDSTPQPSDTPGQYWVWVIDSALSGHGDDTRDTDDDNVRFTDGIGRGKMWFGVDGEGGPSYYRWSAVDGETHAVPLAIGRPN
ncbi:MAG: hypothetical protein V1934_00760 [Methanobacteriota archaeon]